MHHDALLSMVLILFAVLPATAAAPVAAKVATVAMHSELGDYDANLGRLEAWASKAHAAGTTFAVFPELCITGALCKSSLTLEEGKKTAKRAMAAAIPRLEKLCRQRNMTIVAGIVEPAGGRLRNSALVVGPNGHIVTYAKLWLPNRTEERWFEAGRVLPVVRSQGWSLSVAICADIDRPEYFAAAAARGAELMLAPIGGSGLAELVGPDGDQTKQANGHKALHMKFLPAHARDHRLYVFYANAAGKSGEHWFPGLALALDPHGKLIGEHLPTEGMIVTEISKQVLAEASPAKAPPRTVKNSAGETVEVVQIRAKKQ